MKKTALVLALALSSPALAERIVLQDGSTINGEVVSMNNGAYQVKTPSLGVINLPKSQVKSISAGSGGGAPTSISDAQSSALQSLQATMVQDQGIMSSILQLQNDPDMQAVLQDPEVMRAVQTMDLQTLSNHPKIKKLMSNSTVRRIQGRVN